MSYEQVPKISSSDMERQASVAAVAIQQQQAAPVAPAPTTGKTGRAKSGREKGGKSQAIRCSHL